MNFRLDKVVDKTADRIGSGVSILSYFYDIDKLARIVLINDHEKTLIKNSNHKTI